MKISMIGSGAMGSLFGGRLALAGHQVVLYDVYREHVEAITRDGLSMEDAATGAVSSMHSPSRVTASTCSRKTS